MSVNACTVCGSPHHLALVHNHLPLGALWFPPYGNLGTQPQTAAPKACAHGFAEILKLHEDKVVEVMGSLGDAERAIAYKYLHASGLRIGTADEDLRKAIRKELEHK